MGPVSASNLLRFVTSANLYSPTACVVLHRDTSFLAGSIRMASTTTTTSGGSRIPNIVPYDGTGYENWQLRMRLRCWRITRGESLTDLNCTLELVQLYESERAMRIGNARHTRRSYSLCMTPGWQLSVISQSIDRIWRGSHCVIITLRIPCPTNCYSARSLIALRRREARLYWRTAIVCICW